ncbi:uncharacterized protein [Mytilus edulis]|uniref:uncharacterized protein isoform X1 n=1 Tax=Mytilus edulis TaxID=6550 RepID=UPI0039EFC73C
MAAKRSSSIDSGLLSSDVQANREETLLKPVFSTPGRKTDKSKSDEQPLSYSKPMTPKERTKNAEYYTNRRSFHAVPDTTPPSSKADSDSDLGIVPDVTRLLLGSRQRKSNRHPTSPTYSIHINTLYVYQKPTLPVENPLYGQVPAGKRDDKPPAPCVKPAGYQYVWPTTNTEDEKQPEQHHDSFTYDNSKPSSLHSGSTFAERKTNYSGHDKQAEPYLQFGLPSSVLSQGDEMEILIKGKQGNSRRYKLQPISEDTNNKDSFVMNTSEDDKVIIEGFTIDDPDEAFSETRSRQSSSASLFSSSNDASSTAIDTTVDDCRVTVNTFQSKDEESEVPFPKQHISMSARDISSSAATPTNHRYSAESNPNIVQNEFSQAYSMNDPTYNDFQAYRNSNPFQTANKIPGSFSQSVPNIAIASRIDTCYECRNQKRGGIFSSKKKVSRSCTLDGFFYITDGNEVSLMKEVLDQNGKLGNWFITPTVNQPGYANCLYLKTKREVTSFPIAINKKKKMFLDFNLKKSFPCLCQLVEFYKSTHLPSVNINLGQPLPSNAFPDMNFGADSSGILLQQYHGVKL